MNERRFLVAPEDLPGTVGAATCLRGAEHHHLSRVLRLKPGDEIAVFDGTGVGFRGTVEQIGRAETRVRLTAVDDRVVEPEFKLTLAQGIPQLDKMDLIIQKSTELGVSRIVPILAERTVVRPRGGGDWNRLKRWRRVAREAARQSGRLRVPEVADPMRWEQFAADPGHDDSARFLFSATDGLEGRGLHLEPGSRSGVAAVGPEGGWTPGEVSRGGASGFRPVVLGPRTLRTETAGIVAVSLLLFLAGEIGGPGGPPGSGGVQPHEVA